MLPSTSCELEAHLEVEVKWDDGSYKQAWPFLRDRL